MASEIKNKDVNVGLIVRKVLIYLLCAILVVLSIFPFWTMFVNATRSTYEFQGMAVSLIPSTHLLDNWAIFKGKSFSPFVGFRNSMIVSTFSTLCAVYFSTLTAYAIVVYDWKLKRPFFMMILAILMLPGTVSVIGLYQFLYKIHLVNSFIPLIVPSIAAPGVVFFMKQYMEPALSPEIIKAARIDGAREFYIFNFIALPIMKPAIATQAIFCFVNSWNNLFLPSVILTQAKLKTMPIMVSMLKGDIYHKEYGSIYLGLSLTVLPLFVVYFALSKYIIAGVALGSVKG